MTVTPTDRAEQHQMELRRRMSKALTALEADMDHDEREARQSAWACRLLLIGALTAPNLTSVLAWTYTRGHVSDCLHDDTRSADARAVYRRVLVALDGK